MTERRSVKRRISDRSGVQFGFVIGFVGAVILVYGLITLVVVPSERDLCERLDGVRSVEYEVLFDSIPSLKAQEVTARERDDVAEADALKLRANQYRGYLADLRAQVGPWQDEERTDVEEGQLHIDCTEAVPQPPPVSWFE